MSAILINRWNPCNCLICKTLFFKAAKKTNWNETKQQTTLPVLTSHDLICPTNWFRTCKHIYPPAPSTCIMQVEYPHRNQPAWQNIHLYDQTYIICCNMLYLFKYIYVTYKCIWQYVNNIWPQYTLFLKQWRSDFPAQLKENSFNQMGTPGHIETDPLQEAQEAKGKIKRINPRELMTQVLTNW